MKTVGTALILFVLSSIFFITNEEKIRAVELKDIKLIDNFDLKLETDSINRRKEILNIYGKIINKLEKVEENENEY